MKLPFCAAFFFALCFSANAADKPKDIPAGVQEIAVQARAIENFRASNPVSGPRLEWVGGLDLISGAKGFGGLSALNVGKNGRDILAISDAGLWLKLELETEAFTHDAPGGLPLEVEEPGDKPVGVRHAELAPMLDADRKSLAGSKHGDAESLVILNGDAYVGFEGTDEIKRFALSKNGLNATAQFVGVPSEVRQLRHSRGLESLTAFPPGSHYAGALLAIGEKPVKGEDNLRAWIIDGDNFRRLTILPHDDYQISDATFLENGDLLLLERTYEPPFGISCRVRLVKGETISGGARLDGTTIFEAGIGAGIDNMEGISVHKGANGATYVTLVSDDNFNIFQRTLLLRFKFIEK